MGNPHTAPLGELIALVDELETRLTVTRAGYLDNLTNLDKSIAALNDLALTDLKGSPLRFYGATDIVTVTETAVTLSINHVTIPDLTMPSIKHAYAGLLCFFRNSAAAETSLQGAQYIQVNKAAAGWISAISLPNGAFRLFTNDSSWGLIMGNVDVKARVAFNSLTNFQWLDSRVTNENLIVNVVPVIEIIV